MEYLISLDSLWACEYHFSIEDLNVDCYMAGYYSALVPDVVEVDGGREKHGHHTALLEVAADEERGVGREHGLLTEARADDQGRSAVDLQQASVRPELYQSLQFVRAVRLLQVRVFQLDGILRSVEQVERRVQVYNIEDSKRKEVHQAGFEF